MHESTEHVFQLVLAGHLFVGLTKGVNRYHFSALLELYSIVAIIARSMARGIWVECYCLAVCFGIAY